MDSIFLLKADFYLQVSEFSCNLFKSVENVKENNDSCHNENNTTPNNLSHGLLLRDIKTVINTYVPKLLPNIDNILQK